LILAGVGPGDEVISTPMTAEPTNMAILHTGAKIVWADVDAYTGNIDPESARRASSHRTKAIMAVHYGGIPADLESLQSFSYWNQISLIEDCAHALGTKYNSFHVGTGGLGCFSFQAIKHTTTIEGGMLVVDNKSLFEKAKRLRWFGIDRDAKRTEVDVREVGYKYNFNDVLATMGLVQLKHINAVINRYRENAGWFGQKLRKWPQLGFSEVPLGHSSPWFYTIHSENRDAIMAHLQENGIGCGTIHRPTIYHTRFRYPQSEDITALFMSDSGLSKFHSTALHIPCGWWVTPDDREYIAEKIEEALA
jgi:dTDP-4-amino-4,6-dideoxygalactose transaminase